uniref:Uncharacterized protein n=1 Tax=Vespula pensylvanica TaxID=30213 RepID=A0A834UD79_VESPE|nr:hypothetical protein H0235_004790 [Vespula pensylvanica]
MDIMPNVLRRGDPESGREECRQRSVGPLPEEQVSLLLDRRLLESLLRKVNRFVKVKAKLQKLAKLMRDERRREEGREGGRGRGRGEGGSGEEERGRYPGDLRRGVYLGPPISPQSGIFSQTRRLEQTPLRLSIKPTL